MRILAAFLALWASAAAGDGYSRNPDIDVLAYAFTIALSDESDAVEGEATIQARFRKAGIRHLDLDLIGRSESTGMRVLAVRNRSEPLQHEHASNRLRIRLASPSLVSETRSITVSYRGVPGDGLIIGQNRYGDRTFFADNWPNRARHWLPTVDHPSDKALVEFLVEAPSRYQVIANGRLLEQTDLPGERRRSRWRTREQLATKVMVIGVARFALQKWRMASGLELQSWVFPQDREAGFHDFARTESIVEYFERLLGPFPYSKLANVQSRTRYGGMENASAIFYHQGFIQGDRSNERVIAHEVAHQWFGDAVSEADWLHIWLSEGFATYFAELFMESAYGRGRLRAGMSRLRSTVIDHWKRHPASRVVEASVDDLNSLLNANSYQKGAWVLHMLRQEVGEDAFWKGIRLFLRRHMHSNALTRDFRRAMEEASNRQLDWFFRQWVHGAGIPRIQGSWRYDATARELVVDLRQETLADPFRLDIDLEISGSGGDPVSLSKRLESAAGRFRIPFDSPPSRVRLDPAVRLLAEIEFSGHGR